MRNDNRQKNNSWFLPLFIGIIIFNVITSAVGSGVGLRLTNLIAVFIPLIIFFVIFVNIVKTAKRSANQSQPVARDRYEPEPKRPVKKAVGNVYKEHPYQKKGEKSNQYKEHPYEKEDDIPNVYGQFQKIPNETRSEKIERGGFESLNATHARIEKAVLSKERRDTYCPYCGVYAPRFASQCPKCRRKI